MAVNRNRGWALSCSTGGDASQLLDAFGTTEYAIWQTPGVLVDVQVFEVDGGLRVNWDVVEAALPAGWVDARMAAFTRELHGDAGAPAPAPTTDVTALVRRTFAGELGRSRSTTWAG